MRMNIYLGKQLLVQQQLRQQLTAETMRISTASL